MIEGLPLSGGVSASTDPGDSHLLLVPVPSLRYVSLQQQLCRASIHHPSSLPNLSPGKKEGTVLAVLCKTYTHTHIYLALKGEALYGNWGIRKPSVSKAGPASDLQSSYWLEKSQFGCGGLQKNSWAARAHMYNSIYKISYEATRPVPAWFPIHLPTSPKVESAQLHGCETTEIA